MSQLFSSVKSLGYGLLFVLVVAIPNASASTDPSVSFANQIIGEISALRAKTHSVGIPNIHAHHLANRLSVAKFFVKKGKKKLQQGKQHQANHAFWIARHFVTRYIRLLHRKVGKGKVDAGTAQLLIADALVVRTHLKQLIRGDIGNGTPVADAGMDQSVDLGLSVTLNGSGSSDPDGDALTFQWTLTSQPAGSVANLTDDQAVTPALLPDVAGSYVVELVVSDSEFSSAPDSVTVNVSSPNTQPVADAGSDQTGLQGDVITLDGSASSDADGGNLDFNWDLVTVPVGSAAALDSPTATMPTFTADESGLYEAELTVSDGLLDSDPDVVAINIDTLNTAPVANAGPDQSVFTNQIVQLDGSQSSDVDANTTLTWSWSITTAPVGSAAALDDVLAVMPTFTADLAGQYVIQLVVSDGEAESAPDSVIVNALTPNTIPVADAGPDQSDFVSSVIMLDGSGSSDADHDPLNFNWSLTSTPTNSSAALDNPAVVNPSFVLDVPGNYIAQLIVNDGNANSAPDETVISTLNSRPVADAGSDQSIVIGDLVQLDGSASSDADNDPLSYQWSVTGRPEGSVADVSDSGSSVPTITPDEIGFYVFQLIVNDGALDSDPVSVTVQVDPIVNIAITLDAPDDGLVTNQADISISGSLNHTGTLTINGDAVTVQNDLSFDYPVTLIEGVNMFNLAAIDAVGTEDMLSRQVTLDTAVPSEPSSGSITVTPPDPGGIVTIEGVNGSVEPSTEVVIVNLRTNEVAFVVADANGAFSAQVAGETGDAYSILVEDEAGNQSESINVDDGSLPNDPAEVAPVLDGTEITSILDATSFLYSGANPIQENVVPGTIQANLAAVLRGKVLNRQNNALSGVTITIKDHPEYGQTSSRGDGMFDMAVNGGDRYVINYVKDGYLPVQRLVDTGWLDYFWASDVVMIELDAAVTQINLLSTQPLQVARGSVVTDDDGSRQATVMISQGTSATMSLPDGSTQSLTTLNLRATEYTVGENGSNAMPGSLPPNSGYTYAVEFSADEALAVNASSINFSQPVSFYVDNFLGFPVGEVVPVGFYDREKSAWIPSSNGKIIHIVGVINGMVDISLSTSGSIATQNELNDLGITTDERTELANNYNIGDELWRVAISHFTPWDCNWPYGPPGDAEAPAEEVLAPDELTPNKPCGESGCVIEAENQDLGEKINMAGSPLTLNYRSDRTAGNNSANTLIIPLTGADLPASLNNIDLIIDVAGQRFEQRYSATPNQTITWEWDGADAYGREVKGSVPAIVKITNNYDIVYYAARDDFEASFARPAGGFGSPEIIGVRNSSSIGIARTWQKRLGNFEADAAGLGLWTIDVNHFYDQGVKTVFLGDGGEIRATGLDRKIEIVAGTRFFAPRGEGVPAIESSIRSPVGIVEGSDGSFYFAESLARKVRKVDPDGIITTFAGNGQNSFSGDGGPAVDAGMKTPRGLAFGPDGSLYISTDARIRKVDPNGIITTIAGNGQFDFSGDGGPAIDAELTAFGIDVADDGTVFFADPNAGRVRTVDPDGIINTFAGRGTGIFGGDGGFANVASLFNPFDVAIGPEGEVYIADTGNRRIRKVGIDGIITTVAGNGGIFNGDGIVATSAGFLNPKSIDVDSEGALYIGTSSNRVRRVGPDGIISTLAGTGVQGFSGEGGPPTNANLDNVEGVAVGQNVVYIADNRNAVIRRVSSIFPSSSFDDAFIPSEDGKLLYQFEASGRHLRTIDTISNAVQYEFTYEANGLLETIVNVYGDITRINRSPDGTPISIVSPDNKTTLLSLDVDGYLASVEDPLSNSHQITYDPDGLMLTFTDPNQEDATYQYDDLGRLRSDVNTIDGGWTLDREEIDGGHIVSMTTAENRKSTFQIRVLPDGSRERIVTRPGGQVLTSRFSSNGESVTTRADGTIFTSQDGPDSRFGMSAPLETSLSIATPGGLTATITRENSATLSDSNNPLSMTSLVETTTANGRSLSRAYNAATNTWTSTSAENRLDTVQINAQGKLAVRQISGLNETSYGYDSRGRIVTFVDGNGVEARTTTYSYYQSGLMEGYLETVTDAEQQVTRFEYDLVGRVTKRILPDLREINYVYDANGNLKSLQPAGRPAHLYDYTAKGSPEKYTPPSIVGVATPHTDYNYNLDNQLTTVTRPDGQIVNLTYGSATGLLDSISFTGGSYTFNYDPASAQIQTITAPGGNELNYTYDGFLTKNEVLTGDVSGSVERTYDNDFRITSRSINGASTIAYGYDNDNLLTLAGSLVIGREIQKAGLINGTTLGDVSTSQSYNGFAELDTFDASYVSTGTSLFSSSFVRDKLGRITQKTETVQGVSTVTDYMYDQAGRLRSETVNGVTTTYDYDSNGNQIQVNGLSTGTYDDQDRLISYETTNYQYTDNGELLSKTEAGNVTDYQYDLLGNLRRVTLLGSTTIDYVIDGAYRRVGKKVDGILTQGFLYKDELNPIAELDGSNGIVSRFIYGTKGNVPDYMIKGGETYRIISDHLGSPRLVVNIADGVVAQRMDYDTWGNVTNDTNLGFQPFGYAGGLYDAQTGLTRFGARDYDASTARWTSKDPIRFRGGDSNLYGYSFNDPVNLFDLDGLQSDPCSENELPESLVEDELTEDPADGPKVPSAGDLLNDAIRQATEAIRSIIGPQRGSNGDGLTTIGIRG